jgi:hypothetical protein
MFSLTKTTPGLAKTAPAPAESGREAIRQCLSNWEKTPGALAFLTRTVPGAPGIVAMEQFARGEAVRLSDSALNVLAKSLLSVEYVGADDPDPEQRDTLRRWSNRLPPGIPGTA